MATSPHPLAQHPFLKMNGIGNEIIVVDLRHDGLHLLPDHARAIARDPRLAYDQLMVLEPPRTEGTAAFMRIFNNDGTLSSACGNGTRCVAWSLMHATSDEHLTLETEAGLLTCRRLDEWHYSVDMGMPRLAWNDIPLAHEIADTTHIYDATWTELPPAVGVNMGNPHAVFFLDAAHIMPDLRQWGPRIEHDPLFPERVNVSFARVIDRAHIKLDVWERSAGLTRACGSAACATLVAAVRRHLTDRRATLHLPGGDLIIEWRDDQHVIMSGAVELEFEDRFAAELFNTPA